MVNGLILGFHGALGECTFVASHLKSSKGSGYFRAASGMKYVWPSGRPR
jgi:hypothetical protein